VAKAQRIPDVFVDTGMQFTTFYKQQPYLLFPGAPTPEQLGIYLNINCEMPIYYQKQGEIMQAAFTWRQDHEQIEQLRLQIATDVVTAYESVNVARANIIKSKTELLPEALRVASMARRRYEVGKGDLASAILAQQQYQQMLSSYFESVVAYQTAWADLEKAMGVSLKL
jgi:cobalt-zinc-cadmium efflux system outer membrane protein